MIPHQRSTIAPYFNARVHRDGALPESHPEYGICWPWSGRPNSSGYGRISVDGVLEYAHRIAWELVAGPIPDGQYALHTCDLRLCQRNDEIGTYELSGILHERRGHLWLGTYADNVQDMWNKSRHVSPIGLTNPPTGDEHWTRKRPDIILRGDAHPRSKLTAAIVMECRRLVDSGLARVPELAALHGVALEVMKRAVNGKTWSHL